MLRLESLVGEHVIETDGCERRCEIEKAEGRLGYSGFIALTE
jgi:hypothetical protein